MSYDLYAPHYIQHGFRPVPIAPGTKAPHFWNGREFKLLTGWNTREPLCTPQPGAGLGILTGHNVVGYDIDTDDPAIFAALKKVVPDSPVGKRGQRGETLFYYDPPGRPSRKFKIGGKVVCEILAVGSQTVVPPSVHPKTNKPYEWTNGFDLLDVNDPEADLPRLPDNIEDLIEEALAPFGYEPDEETPEPDDGGEAFDTPCGQLNAVALKRLPDWIPPLGLYNCRRQRGSYPSYVAVARWRPSSTGRSLEARDRNLKIMSKGIKDHGDGRTYSAIDLVMAARECDLTDAVGWLNEKLGLSIPDAEVETLLTEGKQPEASPEVPKAEAKDTRQESGVRLPPKPPGSLGEAWHFGDPVPAQKPMLVPGLIPLKGFGYLGGQWGTFKTFVTNDLTVAVGSGGKFAGQQVTVRGAVVQIELEGSHSELRVNAAASIREVQGEQLPIVHLRVEPPKIMNSGRSNPGWRSWAKNLAQYAKDFAAFHSVPLAMITIDPQNSIAGFKDEQSSAEGQIVSDALWKLSRLADCLVLVVDHLGKDPDAGLRGTSAKETNPLFILSTGSTQKDVYCQRSLEVRKMRNGQSGIAVSFQMEDWTGTIEQVVEADNGAARREMCEGKTLVVRWEGGLHATGRGGGNDDMPPQQRRALKALNQMILKKGVALPLECEATPGLKGVKLKDWKAYLIDKTMLEGKNVGAAFSRIKEGLLDREEINVSHDYVWMPLP
jgi:hypothetical protein